MKNKHKHKYKSVFVSDIHIGFSACNLKYLNNFLKKNSFENIFLVGDIIDFWALVRKFYWNEEYNEFFKIILKHSNKGTNIYYITGNHDDVLRNFTPLNFGNIHIVDEMIYNGFMIIHGDKFDVVVKNYKFIAKFGSILYDLLIKLNSKVNWIRNFFGLSHWSLAQYIKLNTKKAVSFIRDFEKTAKQYAIDNNCKGVICGHIHNPSYVSTKNFTYINCGDQIENCSCLVEEYNGAISIFILSKDLDSEN